MCDICKAVINPREDYEGDLIFTSLRMNDQELGYIQVGVQLGISGDDKEPKPEIFMDMDVNSHSTVYDSIKINYCPICGQKLTD